MTLIPRALRTRPSRISALSLLLLAGLGAGLNPTVAAARNVAADTGTSARIPDVHATSLTGQPVDLPAQLRGKSGVLILGFSKDARMEARDWGRRLAGDYGSSPTVLYFEMPVLASVPRLLRSFVLRQIATEVSDRGKPHFAPITADEPRWRTLAHVTDPALAYVLVVDDRGTVRSVRSGQPTDAAYTALRDELNTLHPPPTTPMTPTH